MSSELDQAVKSVEDARDRLRGELADATTPGKDLEAIIDAIDEYIVARVALIKFDY